MGRRDRWPTLAAFEKSRGAVIATAMFSVVQRGRFLLAETCGCGDLFFRHANGKGAKAVDLTMDRLTVTLALNPGLYARMSGPDPRSNLNPSGLARMK